MKKTALVLSMLLAGAGCSFSVGESEENQLANNIRGELTKGGATVKQVEVTRQDDDHMTGFAEVRAVDGSEGRLNCTATRDPSKGARYFDWRCRPAVDERVVNQMEGTIRETITGQGGQVRQVELSRVDDMRMTGFAVVADGAGNETRASCTATRENESSARFTWECRPEGQAPAAAAGGDKE
jgi:hypothetical protein